MTEKIRIAINAQLLPESGVGGVETALRVLTFLGHLDDGPEEYTIIGHWREPEWLRPLLGPRQRIVRGPRPPETKARHIELLGRAYGSIRPAAGRAWRRVFKTARLRPHPHVPISDGFYERLGCDVIHFPFQTFVLCALPSVYNPHDLQHLHYPQFFTAGNCFVRDNLFRAGFDTAHTVVAASQWVKSDIVKQYGVDPGKIQVIPWAPPARPRPDARGDGDGVGPSFVREKYELETPFALYPAVTWEHKNHIRLLQALALLRDRKNVIVNLVCTGFQTDFWPRIAEQISALGLQPQVKFIGVVPRGDLSMLYGMAQFVVVPTLFEAASAPLFEAWQHGAPVACSAVTSLPEQAGASAMLFDPFSVEAIADAVARLATNPALRSDLRRRGARRLQDFSLERTVKAYRAVYRRAAGRVLGEEDRWLLSWDWMRESERAETQSV